MKKKKLMNDVFPANYGEDTKFRLDITRKLGKFMLVKKVLIVFAENYMKKKALN